MCVHDVEWCLGGVVERVVKVVVFHDSSVFPPSLLGEGVRLGLEMLESRDNEDD